MIQHSFLDYLAWRLTSSVRLIPNLNISTQYNRVVNLTTHFRMGFIGLHSIGIYSIIYCIGIRYLVNNI